MEVVGKSLAKQLYQQQQQHHSLQNSSVSSSSSSSTTIATENPVPILQSMSIDYMSGAPRGSCITVEAIPIVGTEMQVTLSLEHGRIVSVGTLVWAVSEDSGYSRSKL